MNVVSVIGVLASIFTGVSLLPQLIKLVKEKKPENVSLGMLAALLLGVGLWICYGFLKDDWIIIISNSFSWLINMTIILLTMKYKKRNTFDSFKRKR